MRVYSATDVGQKRKMNQDYVFVSKDPVGNLPNLFVVADGMGGHNAGDFASSHAVQILVNEIRKDADFNPVKVIRHAIETANTEILSRAQEEEDLRGMGTTIVVATIGGHYACGKCRGQSSVPDTGTDPSDHKRSFSGAGNGPYGRD